MTWEHDGWMTCAAEGSLSLVGLVPACQIADMPGDPWQPVVVHVTTCRKHHKSVRAWFRSRALPEDEPLTVKTEYLLSHWEQLVGPLEEFAPVVAFTRSA